MTRETPASAYDDDFFAWTQEQAAALRQIAKAAVGTAVDIAHVAEEIEDLGKLDLREVTSFLARLFEHMIKIDELPKSIDVPHWRSESLHFQISAAEAFSASVRQSIDIDRIWRQGQKRAKVSLDDHDASSSAPTACPFVLDDFLTDDFDIHAALATLAAAKSGRDATSLDRPPTRG